MPEQFRLFRLDPSEGSSEVLNRFLRQHRVVRTEHQVVPGSDPHALVLVEYDIGKPDLRHEGSGDTDFEKAQEGRAARRFQALKEWRAALARQEGIPAFHILKNEEIDRIVGLDSLSFAALQTVAGLGAKRIEKWGTAILEVLGKVEGLP